jgi:hypothetical protein
MEGIEMAVAAKRIGVGGEDRLVLERIVRSRTAEWRAVERARIVLAAADGRELPIGESPSKNLRCSAPLV